MNSPCSAVKINQSNNNLLILSTDHFPLPKVVFRKDSSGPFTGCNILTVFSLVRLVGVPYNNTTQLTELLSSSTEWGASLTHAKQWLPCTLETLLPSTQLPTATGATFQGTEILKKNTRKAEWWEEKLWCWLLIQVEKLMKTLLQFWDEEVGWRGGSGLLLSFPYLGATQTGVGVSSGFTHSFQLCPKNSSSTESLQHLVGRGSEQRQCCKTGIPRTYLCPWCDFFRLT